MVQKSGQAWRDELGDLMRGVGGAAIIGVPLLFTMEVWQGGSVLPPFAGAGMLVFSLVACTGYNLLSGFRNDKGLRKAVMDAVEAVAIGLLLAGLVLAVIGVIGPGTPLADALHKVSLEAVPLSIGASVANTQFDAGDRSAEETGEVESASRENGSYALWKDAGITAAGALIFAGSIAPTEEVALIAARASLWHLVAIALFSLLLSYAMIFVADFAGREKRSRTPGMLQSPVGETLLSYAIALVIAFAAVITFHGVRAGESPFMALSATLVMALPATIGGAAGRLIV